MSSPSPLLVLVHSWLNDYPDSAFIMAAMPTVRPRRADGSEDPGTAPHMHVNSASVRCVPLEF